jgi:formyltetrahydrofolate synthetase
MADDGAINEGHPLKPIEEIAERAGIASRYLEKYGSYKVESRAISFQA